MAFQKKAKTVIKDTRHTKYGALVKREAKVAALKAENTAEARLALKKMNDRNYGKERINLTEWYAPKGTTISARGKQTNRK